MWQFILPLVVLCSLCQGEPDNSTIFELEFLKLIDPSYGVTWMFLPDGNDTLQIAYLAEEPRNSSRMSIFEVKEKVSFHLYNRKHSKDGIRIRKTRSLRSARKREASDVFDPNLETKFLIHGWQSSKSTDTIQNIKNNYLKVADMNVIAVDWSELAGNIFYITPVMQTRDVGETVAEMIEHLVTTRNASMAKMHLIGHSLGAHCAGFAGSKLGGRVGRISGLDPANPGFEGTPPSERLDPTDALFVDVIHTSAGTAGISMRCGHVDFYPNGGARQPNCNYLPIDILEACSHGRSHEYFAESIFSNQFISYPCRTWAGYKANRCGKHTELMGDPVSRNARGVYYLETNGKSPYAKGKTH
ncbi:phospholipase A1-like [Lutzomyia longipalpis]|uniref:phospholipase A1-like n=1 Tax=Lutzomyia longipalpis TaxID=7200 RepID=UPI002484594F|nr:phospholipase A1-like [Lutzomyia longipalpis]